MNSKKDYIESNLEMIRQMAEHNVPKAEICRLLSLKESTLNKYLKEFNIDYAGNPHRKGMEHREAQKDITVYLVYGSHITASSLRKRLIKAGLKEEKCECCGNTEWLGRRMPLELHHVNFDHYDNRIENLQVLCANCHALAHDYDNRKHKRTPELIQKEIDSVCEKYSNPEPVQEPK